MAPGTQFLLSQATRKSLILLSHKSYAGQAWFFSIPGSLQYILRAHVRPWVWQCLGGCQSQSSYGYALHSSHILIFVDEFTPLSPSRDQHQFSPNNIHALSREKVMRIAKMITKEKMPWSFIKFSQQILKGNLWTSAWRICMWILGLKGLIANNLESTVWL